MLQDRTRKALALALLAGAAIPGAALAQTQSTTASGVASELVVTAQKRAEALQQVPVSVAAVPGRTIEQMHATDLQDFTGYIPGVIVGNAGAPGNTFTAIDGIAPIGAASEVGVYVNDTPVGSSSSFQNANEFTMDLMPYDLSRVEVLRGPQGTLYGASTMGGLIKYVLTPPDTSHFWGRIGGDVFGVSHAGDVGGGVRAAANLPIVNDQLALRVSGYYQSTPGYIDNATTGQKDDNPLSQYGGRAALMWTPSADVSVQLSALFQKNHSDNNAFTAVDQATLQPIAGPLTNINTRAEPYTQNLQLYDLTLNWNLHWAQLTSVSSYQKFDNTTVQDLTDYIGVFLGFLGAPGPGQSDLQEKFGVSKFTQEVRLASPTGGKLEWLAGAFYTHEDASNHEVVNAYDASGAPLTALNPLELVTLPSTYQEYAVFGDVTYRFTDWFDITGGLRYAHNDQHFVETESGSLIGPPSPTPGHSSEGVTTFQVAPELHFGKNTMAYLRIASGYQPGGPNVVFPGAAAAGIPAQFNSSTLVDYQLGVKSTLLDGRATLDLAAFHIDWSKIQVSVLTPAGQSGIVNGGSARSQGFDFGGTYTPIQNLVLGATLAYTDAALTSPIASIGVVKGARLPLTPAWSGSITADYNFPLMGDWRGFAGGGYRYVGSRFSAVEGAVNPGTTNPQGMKVAASNVVDLHLGARTNDLTVSLFAKNLFDERAYVAPAFYFFNAFGGPIDIKAPVLQPRTIGVSIDKSF